MQQRRETRIYIAIGLLLTLMILAPATRILISSYRGAGAPGMMPLPKDEGKSEHEHREQWMEDMHKAAPGTNWRMMDIKQRLARAERYRKNGLAGEQRSLGVGGVLDGSWQERGSKNQSGRIHLAELDTLDQMLYCASSGGQIWRTPAGLQQWEVLTDHLQMKGIHFLRVVHQPGGLRFLIASDQHSTPGFYYSDDTCGTWTPSTGVYAGTSTWGYVRRAVTANDSQHTIYLLAQGWSGSAVVRLLKSTDFGVSFQEILSFPESQVGSIRNCDIWADRYGTGRLFFAKGTDMFEIVQGQPVLKGSFITTAQNQVRLTGYERGSGAILYVMDVGTGTSSCYRSGDDGVTWAWKNDIQETPFMINSFSCSATDPAKLYFGGVEAYRSPTSGVNWYVKNAWQDYYNFPNINLHADIPGLCSFKGNGGAEVLYICTDGGIYRSDNSMLTVTNLSLLDLNASQYYSVYTSRKNTNFIHAGSQDQGYQRSNNQPGAIVSFDQVWSGDYGHIVSGDSGMSIWMNYPGFTVHYNDILYSTTRAWWEFTFQNALWIPPMVIDPYDKNNVLIAGGGFNGGAHLIMVTYMGISTPMVTYEFPYDFSGGDPGVKLTAVATSPVDKDCWYVLTSDGRFFHSPDAGFSWNMTYDFNFSFGHYFYGSDIVPSPNEAGKVYISGSGYSNPPVFELTNFGATVKAIQTGIPSTLVYAIDCTPDEGLIFAATELGPYVYISSQEQWYDLSEGYAPDQTWWSVEYIESLKVARFGTYGRGIWDFNLCTGSSSQPVASFTSVAGTAYLEVIFQDQSTGNPFTWLWDFGDGHTSTQASPTHIYSTPGTYTVRLIAGNVCNRDTLLTTLQVTQIGVTEVINDQDIIVFPNPSWEKVFLRTPRHSQVRISLISAQGQLISSRPEWVNEEQCFFDVSSLAPGIYWIILESKQGRIAKKFMVGK